MAEILVQLLYFAGCPNYDAARRALEEVIHEGSIEIPVQMVLVSSDEDAGFLRFVGSPTIRIDGQDIVPPPHDAPFAMACRIYRDEEGRVVGFPSREVMRAALRARRARELERFQRDEAQRTAAAILDAEAGGDAADPPTD